MESSADQMVKDEIAADGLAFDWLSETFDDEDGYTNKVGIANLLCSLLFMGADSVSGGGSHPHMDIRIKDFYEFYLAKLRETRQRMFPEWVKPEWYVE